MRKVLNAFVNVGEPEFAAVGVDVLHRFDENSETRTIEISDLGQIDNDYLRFPQHHSTELVGDLRRNVEINFPFKSQYV